MVQDLWHCTRYANVPRKDAVGQSTIRRNLQSEHLTILSKMVVEPRRESLSYFYDDFMYSGRGTMPADAGARCVVVTRN